MTIQPRHPVRTEATVEARSEADARRAALDLIAASGVAIVGSIGPDGRPWTKGMLNLETEGLRTAWFSTNTSSARVAQFRANPLASVYYVDMTDYRGLLLLGTMEVLRDRPSRERLWRDGFEIYYPLGIDDPDYSVYRFTAESGNYYHGLQNLSFAC